MGLEEDHLSKHKYYICFCNNMHEYHRVQGEPHGMLTLAALCHTRGAYDVWAEIRTGRGINNLVEFWEWHAFRSG